MLIKFAVLVLATVVAAIGAFALESAVAMVLTLVLMVGLIFEVLRLQYRDLDDRGDDGSPRTA